MAQFAPNLPVVLMTGYGANLTPEQKAMGIAAYIIKPFSQALHSAIRAAWNRPPTLNHEVGRRMPERRMIGLRPRLKTDYYVFGDV